MPSNNDNSPHDESTALLSKSSDSPDSNNDGTDNNNDDSNKQVFDNHVEKINHARNLLCRAHLFAYFSQHVWQFSLTLFLSAICDYQSLILVSSYGFFSSLIVAWLGGRAGRLIDRTQHKQLVMVHCFLVAENVCVVLATIFSCMLLLHKQKHFDDLILPHLLYDSRKDSSVSSIGSILEKKLEYVPKDVFSLCCLAALYILGPCAKLLHCTLSNVIEHIWVKALSKSFLTSKDKHIKQSPDSVHLQREAWLSETNVKLKQIDLSCSVAAPIVASWVIAMWDPSTSTRLADMRQFNRDNHTHYDKHGSDLTGAAILVGFLHVVALVAEFVCTLKINMLMPTLGKMSRVQKQHDKDMSLEKDITVATVATAKLVAHEVQDFAEETIGESDDSDSDDDSDDEEETYFNWLSPVSEMRIYFSQGMSWASFCQALKFLNAMSFGSLMTGFLVWRGMQIRVIGASKGAFDLFGLIGTVIYNATMNHGGRNTLVKTGQWAVIAEFAALTVALVGLFLSKFSLSVGLFIAGACSSRIGMCIFDITTTQIKQEFGAKENNGRIKGIHVSLEQFFELLSFGLGVIFADPKDFCIYATAGYIAVGLSVVIYYFKMYRRQDRFLTKFEEQVVDE